MPLKTMTDEQPSLNLTPMLDVVFLLIIFFMVGNRFTELTDEEKRLDIRVPEVGKASEGSSAPVRRLVQILPDGTIEFDRTAVTLEQLKEKLRAAKAKDPQLSVIVRGDGQAPLEKAAAVYSACAQLGIQDVGLAVRSDGLRR